MGSALPNVRTRISKIFIVFFLQQFTTFAGKIFCDDYKQQILFSVVLQYINHFPVHSSLITCLYVGPCDLYSTYSVLCFLWSYYTVSLWLFLVFSSISSHSMVSELLNSQATFSLIGIFGVTLSTNSNTPLFSPAIIHMKLSWILDIWRYSSHARYLNNFHPPPPSSLSLCSQPQMDLEILCANWGQKRELTSLLLYNCLIQNPSLLFSRWRKTNVIQLEIE